MLYPEKLTVLVVDDEEPLREELRSLPWQDYGAELAGEAENGEEALMMCAGLQPDVIVTDIMMPLMDGLELCRAIRSRYLQTQIILLTCHSEFEYAREAIRLGAIDYLMKVALDEDDMKKALDKAREAIRREHAGRRSERHGKRSELSRLIAKLVKEGGEHETETCRQIEHQLFAGLPPVHVARLHTECQPEYRYEVAMAVHQVLDEQMLLPAERFDWTPVDENGYMLWFKPGKGEEWEAEAIRTAAERIMAALQQGVDRLLPYLSGEVKWFTLLGSSAKEASQLPGILQQLELSSKHTEGYYSGDVRMAAAALSPDTGSTLTQRAPQERIYRKEVQHAMEWMASRLAEPLTLTSVAEEVGLSSFYFSRLFREESGESFNDYLTRLRIDQAIRLLQTTNLKVYEVAERVGIPSYRYFSVVFRGRTGVSPTEFKKG
ncbi:response regulator [Paenibacillus sp. GCM10027626]|uniref:response regulator n=1 Tax=Paenibacillus sp. GCM10027626 TaxID=3273411 RepID=UPI00363DA88D